MARSSTDPGGVKTLPPPLPGREAGKTPPSSPPDVDSAPVVEQTSNARDNSMRRLIERWSVCWLISAIINLLFMLTGALCLIPFQREGGPLTLIASADMEEGELESMITESADLSSLDFGQELRIVDPESAVPPEFELEMNLDLVGSSAGMGPGGWQGGTGSEGQGGGTDYFGTIAYGNRFVYILDRSSSMREKGEFPGATSRFQRAKYELLRSIDKLGPHQSFYVILFSDNTVRMCFDRSRNPETVPATRENKQRLREWLGEVHVQGGTDPREALYLAMSITPDAIFFLSDGDFRARLGKRHGLPFDGTWDVEDLIRRTHRGYSPIHTFAYENPESKRRMEVVADLTGGEYKYIPPMGFGPLIPDGR